MLISIAKRFGYVTAAMFVRLRPSEGHKYGVSIQSFINLGHTLLQIARE